MERFYKLRADGFDKLTRTNLKLRAIIQKVFVFVFVFVGLLSCDNSDPIGDLLGQWQLDEMTYNGTTTKPQNMYLRFQSQYVETHSLNTGNATGHYVHNGDMMTMKFYYGSLGGLTEYNFYNDETIERTEEEKKLEVYPVNIKFHVEKLDANTMILTNDNGRWVFSKW